MMALGQGVSLMAVAPCGRVIGACLNGISQPGDVEELEERAVTCPNLKFKLILGLLAHVEKQSDVHHRFDVENVFEVPMLSVDSAWRGQGIATALLSGSVQLARRLGYPLFRVDCSSEFTARAVSKLGLYPVYTMRYDEYRPSEDMEPPFHPEPPHHEVKAYVMPLNA
jgi:GNAT superfamily N-acetyltransferase